jgi:hypothetical protein
MFYVFPIGGAAQILSSLGLRMGYMVHEGGGILMPSPNERSLLMLADRELNNACAVRG